MPHAIDDDDWPEFKRLMVAWKSGRLTRRPKGEGTPKGKGGRGRLLLGKTTEAIEAGKTGKIVKLIGKQGQERRTGNPFDALSRFGDLGVEAFVLYARVGQGWEIVQSLGCDVPIPDDWYPPEPEPEPEG